MSHRPFSELRSRMPLAAQAEGLKRADEVIHVLQKESAGCVIASLAMATGQTYQQVRDWFLRGDFDTYGISYVDAHAYLGEHGYAVIHQWKHLSPRNCDRSVWPPKPFAPVHICFVMGSGTHAVVMLQDGTVFDPNREGKHLLADYAQVSGVTGVYKT